MVVFLKNCLVKITLRLFQSISVVMNMVPMLLRQFRRLAQGYCSGFPIVGEMNSFTGIFQQHFKLPLCFDLSPPPPSNFEKPPPPDVLNTCGKPCCWSYAKSLKQLILKLHLRKIIFSSLLIAYWRYKPGFFFLLTNKNE